MKAGIVFQSFCLLMALAFGSTALAQDKKVKASEYYTEGQALYKKGEYAEALEDFKKAVEANPELTAAWDSLGLCYHKADNFQEAVKCYEKSLKLDPKGKPALKNMARAYEFMGENKLAGETYLRYAGLYPDDADGYFDAGRQFYLAGDYEKGVDNMCRAYVMYQDTNSPKKIETQKNLAFYLDDLKEKGKFEIFKKAATNNGIILE